MQEEIEVFAEDPQKECEKGWRGYVYEYNAEAGACQFSPWPFLLGGFLLFGVFLLK